MLSAALLINRASQIAKVTGYTAQALDILNSILGDLCEQYDLGLARGVFQFNFNPSLTTFFGSGPYPLPLDYLRTSGTSGSTGTQRSIWYLYQGIPYPMTPIDLAEFDMQIQQAGLASLPKWFATDMGGSLTDRITLATTGLTTAASTAVTGLASVNGLAQGLAVAGEGITPGTTVAAYAGGGSPNCTLSLPATATSSANGASLFFGIAPVGYAYWPPLGAYPVTVRYQRKMPPITDTSKIPWFPNEGFLRKKLAAGLMEFSSDTRKAEFEAEASRDLDLYLKEKDDLANRATSVVLDARRFSSHTRLPITKQVW